VKNGENADLGTEMLGVRELLAAPLIPVDAIKALDTPPEQPKAPEHPCPCCGGPMRIIETFLRGQQPPHRASPVPHAIRA
jgi:hypothetical protein